MLKNNSKFNPKPINVPSEEEYMTNKNPNRTLNLLGSKRDNMDESSREGENKAFKINRLAFSTAFLFQGLVYHEKQYT